MAKKDRSRRGKLVTRVSRKEENDTKNLIRNACTPKAQLTKEAKKTILSAKKEDNENEVANFN